MTQTDKDRLPFAPPPKPSHSPKKDNQASTGRTNQYGIENKSPPKVKFDETKLPIFAHRLLQPGPQASAQNSYVDDIKRSDTRPQSSSLTDILGSVSPTRTGFHDFQPACPSAVPSPLRRVTSSGSSPLHRMVATKEYPPRQKPTMSIDDHFFVTNEHIDVVACTLWDKVAAQAKQQTDDSSAKHDKLLSLVDQQFGDVKSQVSSINSKSDQSATQVHNLVFQLNGVMEVIKKEVVSCLEAQTKKMVGMEQTVKELQKAIHDLQMLNERNHGAAGHITPQSAMNNFPLPNHRSQPSLAGYYDNSGREPTSHQQQAHSYIEGQRSGNSSYLPWHGYGSREGKDCENPFSRTNPYYTPSNPGSGSLPQGVQHQYGYSPNQEYQQYQNLQQHQQHYGSNQGPAK
jgi:hypothetical protein